MSLSDPRPVEDEERFWRRKGKEGPLAEPFAFGRRAKNGAALLGDVTMLTVGCTVWSRERFYAGPDRSPLGGVIVRIDEKRSEDGEVWRFYVCIDPYRTRPTITLNRLEIGEVDPEAMEGVLLERVRLLWRRLAEEIGRGRGMASTREIEIDRYQHVLLGALAA